MNEEIKYLQSREWVSIPDQLRWIDPVDGKGWGFGLALAIQRERDSLWRDRATAVLREMIIPILDADYNELGADDQVDTSNALVVAREAVRELIGECDGRTTASTE